MSYNGNSELIKTEIRHYYSIGRYQQAIDKIREGLSQMPNDAELHYLKATCLFHLNQYKEAEEDCQQALTYDFSSVECYYLLGRVAMEVEQYVKSEEYLLQALRENPNRADINAVYGFLMLKAGHDKKAKLLLEEALRIDPEDETANQVRLIYFLIKNKQENISASLQQYFQVSSNEASRLYNLGVIELNAKKYHAAREHFRQAFLLDPTNEELLGILGKLDRAVSPIFLPERLIYKVGGPVFVWIGAMGLMFILRFLHLYLILFIIAICYIVLCIYTWISPLLYKIFSRHH